MLRLADRTFWLLPFGAWTVLVALSLVISLKHADQVAFDTARQQGRDIFSMVQATRLWNSRVGPLLVPQSALSPPNPYLDIPDRDPVTTSGVHLTTVNPAYMTRQIAGVIAERSGIRIHLTSLRPINPINAADEWESAALQAFEAHTDRERSEIVDTDGPTIRYMAPLLMREECMACHQKYGYKVGDVRGGISVSLPAADFVAHLSGTRRNHLLTHGLVWAVVSVMMMFYLRQYRRQWNSLKSLTATLEDRVAERTRQLESETAAHQASEQEAHRNHARFLDLVNTTDGIVWECDAVNFVFTFVSRKAETLLGYPVEAWQRPGFWVDHLHPEDREWAPGYCAACTGRLEPHRFEYRFIASDGRTVWLDDIVTVVAENGKPVLLRGLMVDITARKEAETEVRQLTQRLTLATRAAQIGIWEYEPATGRVLWDGTMFDIFGLTHEQFHEHVDDVTRLIHPDDLPHVQMLVQDTLDTGCEFQTSFRIVRGDHEIRHIDAHAVLVPASGRRPARIIGVNRDITERKRNEHELVRLATTDPLTGCHNRGYLGRVLENEVERTRRYGDPLSLIMYDLDRFKRINDTWGHDVGDQVLIHTTRVVGEAIRRTDVLARWGGEEFMVLCPRTTAEEAAVLAQRLLQALRDSPTPVAGVVTASVGVVTLHADEGITEVLKRVDHLMYCAKETGRNRVCGDMLYLGPPKAEDSA